MYENYLKETYPCGFLGYFQTNFLPQISISSESCNKKLLLPTFFPLTLVEPATLLSRTYA